MPGKQETLICVASAGRSGPFSTAAQAFREELRKFRVSTLERLGSSRGGCGRVIEDTHRPGGLSVRLPPTITTFRRTSRGGRHPAVGWQRDLSELPDQQQMVGGSTLIPDRSSTRIAAAAQRVFAMGRGTVLASSWYRAALPRYSTSSQLLSGRGTLIRGGRWCPPGFMLTLHLADTPENSVAEYLANHRRHGIPIPADLHLVIRAVQIEIACALDLRDGVVRQALGVSRQRMLETRWEQENAAGHESVSQAVGRAVAAAGFTAMVVPSAAVARAVNLVVFPELLRGQDRVEVCDAE